MNIYPYFPNDSLGMTATIFGPVVFPNSEHTLTTLSLCFNFCANLPNITNVLCSLYTWMMVSVHVYPYVPTQIPVRRSKWPSAITKRTALGPCV